MENDYLESSGAVKSVIEKVIKDETVTAREFFQCIANLRDCDIFVRIPQKATRDKMHESLSKALPEICKRYWTYKAILIAIKDSIKREEERAKFKDNDLYSKVLEKE